MLKKILILSIGALLMTSCSESFNSIYEEVEEKDPNVVPPGEVDMRKVNILPTLSDPLYSIVGTRAQSGLGPFGDWDTDKKHWLDTRFQVFGLRTSSTIGGSADYSKASQGDKQYGVLWNQTMGIIDQQGTTRFYDEEDKPLICRYNNDDKLYRYKFFLLGTDGLENNVRAEGKDKVVASMSLDGKHDILHSFAYHTDKQFSEAVAQLPNDETTKVFLDGGEDASSNQHMYNRLSGNRGIHPIFSTKHLLSRFDICVKGGNPKTDKNCDFLKVLVKSVSIKAAKDVDIVVADDAWESDTYEEQFKSNKLIRWDGVPKDYDLEVVPNKMRNTAFTSKAKGEIDFDALAQEYTYWSGLIEEEPVPLEDLHWVGDSVRDSLCKTVLLPPLLPDEEGFVINLSYRYLYTYPQTLDDGTVVWKLGQSESSTDVSTLWDDFNNRPVAVPNTLNDGTPIVYEGGRKYTIVITIYGQSIVRVEVTDLTMWNESDEDINVGEETLNPN